MRDFLEVMQVVLPGAHPIAQSVFTVELLSAADDRTAHSGGGQSGATPITTRLARFTTVAADGDSALLPPAVVGLEVKVYNASTTHYLSIWGAGSDTINTSPSYQLFAVKSVVFSCLAAGKWSVLLSG